MGEAWKAPDTSLARVVAMKFSAEQFSEQFEREAKAISSLNHANICQLYDIGPNYLVVEYIEGAPLKRAVGKTSRRFFGKKCQNVAKKSTPISGRWLYTVQN